MAIPVLRLALVLLFSATVAAAQAVPVDELRTPQCADMVFYNGPVVTVDDRFTIAEGVAVRDGKILGV